MNKKKVKKLCGCWLCRGRKLRNRVADREFKKEKKAGLYLLTGILVPVLLLSSCATTRPGQTVPPSVRTPPADAVQTCPSLADVPLGKGGLADLARALQTTADRYQECRARHAELVEWVGKK